VRDRRSPISQFSFARRRGIGARLSERPPALLAAVDEVDVRFWHKAAITAVLIHVRNWGATLGNHIRRRLRIGRCGASLFGVGALELATQNPW